MSFATAAQVIGTGATLQAGAQQQQATQASGAADMAAGAFNAQIAEQNAVLAEDKAAQQEKQYRIIARRQMGAIDAAYAASGVDKTGSATDVMLDSAATAEQNALNIRHAGQWEAFGYRSQAIVSKLYGAQAGAAAAATAQAQGTSAAANALLAASHINWGS